MGSGSLRKCIRLLLVLVGFFSAGVSPAPGAKTGEIHEITDKILDERVLDGNPWLLILYSPQYGSGALVQNWSISFQFSHLVGQTQDRAATDLA